MKKFDIDKLTEEFETVHEIQGWDKAITNLSIKFSKELALSIDRIIVDFPTMYMVALHNRIRFLHIQYQEVLYKIGIANVDVIGDKWFSYATTEVVKVINEIEANKLKVNDNEIITINFFGKTISLTYKDYIDAEKNSIDILRVSLNKCINNQ